MPYFASNHTYWDTVGIIGQYIDNNEEEKTILDYISQQRYALDKEHHALLCSQAKRMLKRRKMRKQ